MPIVIRRVDNPAMQDEAYEVRKKVFIEEQKVPEELELDEYDLSPDTVHIVAYDEHLHPVGTARLRPYHPTGVCKVERVAVLPSHRKMGLGERLMQFLEQEAGTRGYQEAFLNAQTQAQSFYERLGYAPEGALFFEAGIEHVAMRKNLTSPRTQVEQAST